MMRPTPKAVAYFSLSIPAALMVVIVFPESWFLAIYAPAAVLAMMAADITMALPKRCLHIGIEAPTRLYIGQSGTVKVKLGIDQYKRTLSIEAILTQTGEAAPQEPRTGQFTDGLLTFNLPVTPRLRGRLTIDDLWLRWRSPLGLMELRVKEEINQTIEIVPDIQGIHEAAIQFFARDAIYGVKAQKMRGEGTEFDNLCEYAHGMDSRFIDWKRSAHHRKLLCKEFRQERNHQIILGFDTGHLMLEPIDNMPKLDHAIKASLLLGWISLYGGDLIGGCGFDASFRNFLKPGRGMPYFTQFQKFTSRLTYQTEETNFTLGLAELNSRLQRRALVVLFTEFVDSISAELLIESLQLISRRHLIIFVTMRDPMLAGYINAAPDEFSTAAQAVIADDFLRERSVVLERVARMGIHCLDVPAQGVSAALLNRYLLIKQRGLL